MNQPIYERLKVEAPVAHATLLSCVLSLALTIFRIQDESEQTAYEYAVAIANMLDSLGMDEGFLPPQAHHPTASDVPLYKRLLDSEMGHLIGDVLSTLNRAANEIPKGDLQDAYDAAMRAFWAELAIPTVEEIKANPEQHPDLNRGLAAQERRNKKLSEVKLLEEMFRAEPS